MYAAEFEAKIENGQIHVPEQFTDRFRNGVRVILLAVDSTTDSTANSKEPQSSLIEQLLANPVNIPQFHPLKRDEIYAR